FYLSYFSSAKIKYSLLERLKVEKKESIKILIVNALKNNIDQLVLQGIIDSLINCRRFYQSRVIGILQTYLQSSEAYLHSISRRNEIEIKEVFVDLANVYYKSEFKLILLEELSSLESHFNGSKDTAYQNLKQPRILRLYYRILIALSNVYGYDLSNEIYLQNSDKQVLRIATNSLGKLKTLSSLKKIISYADGTENDDIRAESITEMIDSKQELLLELIEFIPLITNEYQSALIAQVISHKIEYLILKMIIKEPVRLQEMLEITIKYGYREELIDFLNENNDKGIENFILKILKVYANEDESLFNELNEYLNKDLFQKMGFVPFKIKVPKKEASTPEIRKTKWLLGILFFSIILLPLLFSILHLFQFSNMSFLDLLSQYITSINQWFIVYYLTVNFVYLILAFLSFFENRNQLNLWNIKGKNLLFEKGMLSSISIIAPAFNEELSIVESIQSLLNLNYPNFEVIVVNDGSKDSTLQQMITHFSLERKNIPVIQNVKTKNVKAVYKNRYFPNLTVVDKLNGGKADALNCGINFSKNDYVCGIDADSILEPNSLLKLMSSMLDHETITLALGGSIVPVNGSSVDHGKIETISLPKSNLAKFQTIEYLRAFNIGRLGFAKLNSLLIVSGAFGLFEKRILIESGGYLTVDSLKKDTVGEDMELVVRITRNAYEQNLQFRIDYIANAKCYTEVPEERKSFFRQRNRWQRGLIDILSYHRKMILNHKYKQPGIIGMFYFFLFEMIGPLFEIQAYIAIIIGFIFGILNIEVLFLLLLVTVGMGIVLSLLALYINERDSIYLSNRDTFKLIFYAILENFGWRQLISIYRVKGFLSSLRETNAWGQMNRVGFKK
ncbi:MAG: glycosyltransferase family 2 protein, partial [Firmicutes bacterium]|nr:glycosyltransferase family 2 protein [Bacillota bacterium]